MWPKTKVKETSSPSEHNDHTPYSIENYSQEGELLCPPHTTERRLVNKIDWHVIPYLCVLYLLAFLDRVNISNANIFGLSEELDLNRNNRYNNALVIFFVPYILFEIPSNILLKKFRPRVWLSVCMFGFGFVTTMQGLVKNYAGLLTTRFFLGFFETGMFPGCFYLIGMWYRRHEAQRRYSFFFSSTTLAGAFGGLLASAIGKMNGMNGYLGWRWIFILEGVLTCVVSFAFFFLIPDFPEQAKWLTKEESAFVQARLHKDQGRSAIERPIKARDVFKILSDPMVLIGGLSYFSLIVPAYAYAYFSPAIIRSYGYSPIQTQLHSVPPWACAFAFSMIIAYCSDKFRHRYAFAVLPLLVTISGFAILIVNPKSRDVKYASLFLVAMGAYTAMPIIVCWFNMNLGGHHRRAVGSAWQVAFGNIGGIIAIYSFLSRDAPRYITGYSICLAFVSLGVVSCTVYLAMCTLKNRSRERAAPSALTEEEKTELGDRSPDYRYLR